MPNPKCPNCGAEYADMHILTMCPACLRPLTERAAPIESPPRKPTQPPPAPPLTPPAPQAVADPLRPARRPRVALWTVFAILLAVVAAQLLSAILGRVAPRWDKPSVRTPRPMPKRPLPSPPLIAQATVPSPGVAALTIDVRVGNVTVQTTDEPAIAVEGRRVIRGPTDEHIAEWLRACELVVERHGESVIIRDVWPSGPTPWQDAAGRVSLDLTVHCPPGLAARTDVGVGDTRIDGEYARIDLKAGTGDLTARTRAGDTKLATDTGDLVWEGVAARLALDAGTGSITARGTAADSRLTTATGDIVLQRFASREAAAVEVEVGTGDIAAELTALPARTPLAGADRPSVTLRAGTGDVTLALVPGDDGLRLDASTGVGPVEVRLDLANRTETKRAVGATVKGVVGAAQCAVAVAARVGSIDVRQLDTD